MKLRYTKRLSLPFAAAIAALIVGQSASAASVTWDADGTTTAPQTDGAGVWLAADLWWDGAANVTWTSGDDAIFGNGGPGGAVTIASPTTVNSLTFNAFTGTYTLGTSGQAITLNNGITKNTGSAAATISSPITLGAAQTWTNNSTGLLTVGTDAITNGANLLTINGTGNTTISGVIGSGAGGVTKSGGGNLVLSGANTFTGTTTLTAGILQGLVSGVGLTPTSPLGAGSLALDGGTLQLRASGTLNTTAENITFGNNTTVGANSTIDVNRPGATSTNKTILLGTLSIGANTLNVTGGNTYGLRFGATTLTGDAVFNPTSANLTLAGIVSDGASDFSLTKNGSGSLTLTGVNTYSGGTVINAGILTANADNNLGDAAGGITFSGNSTLAMSGTITHARQITVNPGVTATILSGAGITYTNSGKVTGAGNLLFQQTGNGTRNLLFSNLGNDFTGSVTVDNTSGQQLAVGFNSLVDSLGAGNIIMTMSGANGPNTFRYGSGATGALTLNHRRIELTGNVNTVNAIFSNQNTTQAITINTNLLVSSAGSKGLTLDAATGPVNVFAGIIANGGGGQIVSIFKAGSGTWTLSGDNTYSGGTNISAGKLNINSATAVGTGTITVGAAIFDNTSGSAITLTNNNLQTWNGDFTFTGTNNLNLGTGNVTLGGTRNIAMPTAASTLTVGGVIGAASSAAGIQRTSGGGTLAFNGANTYGGLTTVSAGTLQIGNANALGYGGLLTTTISGTTASTGTIDLNGITGVNEPITLNGNGVGSNGALVNKNTGAAASIGSGIAGIRTLTATTGTAYSAPPAITISGTGSGATATSSLGLTTASITAITNGGTASWAVNNTLSVTGGGGTGAVATVTSINGSGQITGLNITTAGTGYTSAPTTLTRLTGSGTGTPTATFNATQFTVTGVRMTAAGSGYTGTPTYTFDSGDAVAGTLSLSSVNLTGNSTIGGAGDTTINAVVSGAFNLTKVGAGVLTLTGANTYTGTTNINAGTVALGANNTLPDTDVSIGNATLNAATFANDLDKLDVTGAATINLGSGAALAFDTGSPAWTGSLAITGTFVSGSSLRFGTDNTGLTALQLAAITKPGGGAVGLDSNGYLVSVGSGGYSAWAATNAISSTPGQDKDNDGVTNAVEYVLGGSVTTNDLIKLPAATTPSGNLVFTFLRDQASIDGSTTVAIEVGTTLAAWPSTYTVGVNTAGSTAGVVVNQGVPVGFDTITLTIPQSPDPKKFARLKVNVTP